MSKFKFRGLELDLYGLHPLTGDLCNISIGNIKEVKFDASSKVVRIISGTDEEVTIECKLIENAQS